MFTCSSPYGMPGTNSNGLHQRLSTSSSLEDQPPSFNSDFCSPPAVSHSFNSFLTSPTDVPIHHALSLSNFENNNDISCHSLKVEPTIEPPPYHQQQQTQPHLLQHSQQQALLGLQQTSHHPTSLLMQSSLNSMGSSSGSIIPPISSLHRHMSLPASHMPTNNGELVSSNPGHDLISNSLITSPIILPQTNSPSNVATSRSVMDLMVSTPSSVSSHQTHHRDPGEPPPGLFGAKENPNSSSMLTNGNYSILDSRHNNLMNSSGNRILAGDSNPSGMIPPYNNPLAAAAAALCTSHTNDMHMNGSNGCNSVGSMQPVDLTHQQHHQQAHHQQAHHPHHQHQQQSLILPSVMMAPQQHPTSSPTSATTASYQQQQPHSQQPSHSLSSLSPMAGSMASEWAFVDHSSSRCLTASTPVTNSCPTSEHHLPPVPASVDHLSRSFLSNGFSSPATNCIPNSEEGHRDRRVARPQMIAAPSSTGVVGRCGNVEEPLLTNLGSWKMVHGEPMEMEVNGSSAEESNCMVSTAAPSIVSMMPPGTVMSHAGMHIGAPILSRQGSVDELITHCLSGETENMLSDPDLWQILSSEPHMDHNPHVIEDHDGVKIKRSLSTDPVCQQPVHLLTTRTSPSILPISSMAPSTPSQHSDAYTPSPTSSLPSYSGDGPLTSSLPSIITSHFWKYNAQSKGPKARRMDLRDPGASKDPRTSPYRLVEFRDPVQDRNDLIHCTKIRKGDGNDITPNPLKLHKMGLELHRLNGQIQAVVSTTEGDRVKKEKNRIASQSCRLKRKAYNEANKIKLFGLGLEHSEFCFHVIQIFIALNHYLNFML